MTHAGQTPTPKRLMTERDYTLLLQLRDLAWALNDQIDAIEDAVGSLVGMRPSDDGICDLIRNHGDIGAFLDDANLQVVENGVRST